MLNVDIPEDMAAKIREICKRRQCDPDEAVREVLRRWIAVEQLRRDSADVRRASCDARARVLADGQ